MFRLANKNFSSKYYNSKTKSQSDFFFSLDCRSGEGQTNLLLMALNASIQKYKNKDELKKEFEFYLEFFLKKCININRSFSDAIQFLSIWLKISPNTLLKALQNAELKQFFNRTEYDHEGDQWYFPKLLYIFSSLVERKLVTADEILDYVFETFNFFSEREIFVTEIIGYDRLEVCIKESPAVFKQALLSKMYEFVGKNKLIDIGFHSRRYLNDEIQENNAIKRTKTEKLTDPLQLVSYIKKHLFIYPSKADVTKIENFSLAPPSNNFRGSGSY